MDFGQIERSPSDYGVLDVGVNIFGDPLEKIAVQDIIGREVACNVYIAILFEFQTD
ncbi:MAG: hypothetical protein DSM106950_14945 [Stigonema ocellatum SAG 48.90 = DSM 106950]|nr:hypothetical protein [Stigonema ocellatum SAG 48.90 = DSM 106950]